MGRIARQEIDQPPGALNAVVRRPQRARSRVVGGSEDFDTSSLRRELHRLAPVRSGNALRRRASITILRGLRSGDSQRPHGPSVHGDAATTRGRRRHRSSDSHGRPKGRDRQQCSIRRIHAGVTGTFGNAGRKSARTGMGTFDIALAQATSAPINRRCAGTLNLFSCEFGLPSNIASATRVISSLAGYPRVSSCRQVGSRDRFQCSVDASEYQTRSAAA